MSNVPDAWEDEWSSVADTSGTSQQPESSKKVSSKVSKAQKRAQQAEFNRQLWAEANNSEGPKEPNFFLESRNVVPLRQEYKPPPILLSRKGPITQSSRPLTQGIDGLRLRDESSEDEDEAKSKELSLAERQAQAAKDREEKQRKYEERRLELFGPQSVATGSNGKSGNSSPGSGTPPHSRSSTPSRGGRRGRGGRGNPAGVNQHRAQQGPARELYDVSYAAKPDSVFLQRREGGSSTPRQEEIQPIRAPRGPDGTAGFGSRFKTQVTEDSLLPSAENS